jgi:hypothetical protein
MALANHQPSQTTDLEGGCIVVHLMPMCIAVLLMLRGCHLICNSGHSNSRQGFIYHSYPSSIAGSCRIPIILCPLLNAKCWSPRFWAISHHLYLCDLGGSSSQTSIIWIPLQGCSQSYSVILRTHGFAFRFCLFCTDAIWRDYMPLISNKILSS